MIEKICGFCERILFVAKYIAYNIPKGVTKNVFQVFLVLFELKSNVNTFLLFMFSKYIIFLIFLISEVISYLVLTTATYRNADISSGDE